LVSDVTNAIEKGADSRVMGTPFVQLEESLILGSYDALLFDMDGTILTSIAAAERAWSAWAARVGISAYEVLSYVHGRTAADTIRHFLPPTADINAEVRWLNELELADLDGIAEVPGAGAFLGTLPIDRWAGLGDLGGRCNSLPHIRRYSRGHEGWVGRRRRDRPNCWDTNAG
jgi:hypothetical protein